uniref:Palmitoyltransferase n=1 Tax=Setaria digitata TaxID=48799 RepID=A0A915PZ68_9BILA
MDDKTRFCGLSWCVRDTCGLTCAVFTWLLILYGEFCVLTVMMASWSKHAVHQTFHAIIFHILACLAFASHLRTMFTDPGAVPKGNATDEYIQRLQFTRKSVIYKCSKCSSVKPERAHHCSVCGRCVRRMDHHCPWVNNCVGEGNQNYLFFDDWDDGCRKVDEVIIHYADSLSTERLALLSTHAVYWGIWQFVFCVSGDWQNCSLFGPPVTAILLVFLLFEAILFAIFTLIMFGTQLNSICNDQTSIESLKNEQYHSGPDGWKNLQMIFGGPFSLQWFSPFAAPHVTKLTFEYSV